MPRFAPDTPLSDSDEEEERGMPRYRASFIKLKPFQGRSEENWFSWVQLFEENIRLAGIKGDRQIVLRFAATLDKGAADFFHELTPEIQGSWERCKAAFSDEFTGEHNAVSAKMEWARICMKAGENARDYFNRFVKTY